MAKQYTYKSQVVKLKSEKDLTQLDKALSDGIVDGWEMFQAISTRLDAPRLPGGTESVLIIFRREKL